MSTAAKTVVVALTAVVVFVVLWGAVFAFNWFTAPAAGKLQARQQINGGSYRIEAYDHFFNLCASVQTDEQTLQASKQELATATTQSDRERIQTNITGLLGARAEAVNQYNADAAKGYTVGQFKASNLPYRLPQTYSGGITACAV